MGTSQLLRLGLNVSVVHADGCAKLLQTIEVNVHWSCADRASTRGGYAGAAKASEQGSQDQKRRTHSFDQFIRGLAMLYGPGTERDLTITQPIVLHPEVTQESECSADIHQLWHPVEAAFLLREQ
jgi:hypothetical protein